MIYPDNFESKIGFDRIKSQIKALCVTQGAADKLSEAEFSNDYEHGRAQTRASLRDADRADAGKRIPGRQLRRYGAFPEKGRRHRRISGRGGNRRAAQGTLDGPRARRLFRRPDRRKVPPAPGTVPGRRADFRRSSTTSTRSSTSSGRIRDNASAELFAVRRTIREREGQASRRLLQIMGAAQASGLVDADASVSVRDGRAVIPVSAANKRKIKGLSTTSRLPARRFTSSRSRSSKSITSSRSCNTRRGARSCAFSRGSRMRSGPDLPRHSPIRATF